MEVNVVTQGDGTSHPDAFGHDDVSATESVERVNGGGEGVGVVVIAVADGTEVKEVQRAFGKTNFRQLWHGEGEAIVDGVGDGSDSRVVLLGKEGEVAQQEQGKEQCVFHVCFSVRSSKWGCGQKGKMTKAQVSQTAWEMMRAVRWRGKKR